jgi:hypothetical protein
MNEMESPKSQARRICTEAEFDLVESSYYTGTRSGKPGRLRERIQIVRKLRDKYRDLARRGEREARRRSLSRPAEIRISEVRAQKAKIFQETLSRLETELAKKRPPPADS